MVKMQAPNDTRLIVRTPAPRLDSRLSSPNSAPTTKETIIRRANSVSCRVRKRSCGHRWPRYRQSSGKRTFGTLGTRVSAAAPLVLLRYCSLGRWLRMLFITNEFHPTDCSQLHSILYIELDGGAMCKSIKIATYEFREMLVVCPGCIGIFIGMHWNALECAGMYWMYWTYICKKVSIPLNLQQTDIAVPKA